MRVLALACIVVLAGTVSSAPSISPGERATLAWALDQSNALRGSHVTVDDHTLVARESLVLPDQAVGIRALVDWTTGELSLAALHPLPIDEVKSGCVLPQGGAGWLVSPVGAGDASSGCAYESHLGGIRFSHLACALGPECALDLGQVNPFQGHAWIVTCRYQIAVYASYTWGSLTHTEVPLTAYCSLFFRDLFGFPVVWEEHDALVLGTPQSFVAGFNNLVGVD